MGPRSSRSGPNHGWAPQLHAGNYPRIHYFQMVIANLFRLDFLFTFLLAPTPDQLCYVINRDTVITLGNSKNISLTKLAKSYLFHFTNLQHVLQKNKRNIHRWPKKWHTLMLLIELINYCRYFRIIFAGNCLQNYQIY